MPCDCSHLEPNAHEAESKRVAEMLVQLLGWLRRPIPVGFQMAAEATYGAAGRVHELTAELCETIEGLTKDQLAKVIYNGRSPAARKIADWWDNHRKADAEKAKLEKSAKAKAALRKRAIAKLTPDERRALGH